jgi:hypothetical protein
LTQKQYGEENDYGEEEYDGEGDAEFAIDRAHKIGFFLDNFEFCLKPRDIKVI